MESFLSKQIDLEENKIIIVGCFVQCAIWFGLYFWRNLYVKYVLLFAGGLTIAKNILVYILCTEISPKKYQVYVGAYCLSIDPFMVLVPTSIYLLGGGKYMQHILIMSLAFSVLAIFASFLVPESPRYLYERKYFGELRENLKGIAKINGVKLDPQSLVFGK